MNRPKQQQQVPQSDAFEWGWGRDRYGNKVWMKHPRKYYPHHRRPILQIGNGADNGNNSNTYNGNQQQQQQQQQQEYYAEDDYSDEGYGAFDDGGEYDAQDNNQNDGQFQGMASSVDSLKDKTPLHHAMFANMSNEELAMPAKVKFETVIFEASREIRMSQLIGKDMKLKNNGTLTFSRENGHLEPISATCKKHVIGAPISQARNDLVSEIGLEIYGNYSKKLLVSIPTIGAIGDEYFRDGANHVNFTIPAGALSLTTPFKVSLKRDITNNQIAFATVFDSTSPDTMEADIAHVKGRDFSYVPLTHSIMHYWNRDHPESAITEETADPSLGGDVKMKTADVMKYLEIAKQSVSSKLSLGNVTTNAMVVISACEPTESKMSLRSKEGSALKQATPFMGLADANYYLGKGASENAKSRFLDTPFQFDMTLTFKYVKLDDSPIEFVK